ncbi:MAG: hypothetical protein CVV21_08910 [Candidatus Goldiibacteriota bacterium HGW-Goldbacteria-1]|jgi:hypothetical protein|nr:MAG: hypothetical protein CVV21_08910 [Candidatus Goldiibacteriota bacterium HGW-Goldbacteria-1]
MKKFVITLIVMCFVVPFSIFAEESPAAEFQWAPVVLLASDALLVTASVMAIVQQNTLATDYDTLKTNLGELDEAEYWRLKYEKEKVTAAEDLVLISTITAGAALCYTAIDYFWLHNAFKGDVSVKTGYDAKNKAYSMAVNIKY